MQEINILLLLFAALGIGSGIYSYFQLKKRTHSDSEAQKTLSEAEAEAREIVLNAKDEAMEIKEDIRKEMRELKEATEKVEQRVLTKEEKLDTRLEKLEEREENIKQKESSVDDRLKNLEEQREKLAERLEDVASLTKNDAEERLLSQVEEELEQEIGKRVKEAEERIEQEADTKAREILVDVMKQGATNYVPEHTTSTIKLEDDDMKGRVIGREGRNIKAFEKITGVNVDLDETPGEVRLSSFDPVRREIARVALKRLIDDGRIQPARIEEIVKKTKKDIEQIMFKEGEKLCHEVDVYNLPKDLVALLGRFKYRYSYGQNMIQHTLEETKIGIKLAEELGADTDVVRLACLLHDIGKVVDEDEGTHVELGVELLKKYDMPQEVINCVAEHHEDKPFSSVESVIVYIVDAISASRPGARNEDHEAYAKRMEDLENAAKSFSGVDEAYAISAGREVRVIVEPKKVDDLTSFKLARDIANKIERELVYPGQVKVTVVREIRAEETAR